MKIFNTLTNKFSLIALFLSFAILPSILLSDAAPDYFFSLSEKIQATASSILIEPGKSKTRYSAEKAMDGKLDTSWCEGKGDDGIGESITLTWKPTLINGIVVGHGVLLNRNYYLLNNRIKEYEATVFYSSGEKKMIRSSFSDYSCQNECESLNRDTEELEKCETEKTNVCSFQEFDKGNMVGGEEINVDYGCSTGLQIKILSVFPGKKFKDTCISEIILQIPDPKMEEEWIAQVEKDRDACK